MSVYTSDSVETERRSSAEDDFFIVCDYQKTDPFSSFLPGIAGVEGIPLWSFYTNRGQGITSFGVKGKDNPILEFHPADQAVRSVSTLGFRTFLLFENGERREAFRNSEKHGSNQKMLVGKSNLTISEEFDDIKIEVTYNVLPNESFPALMRRLEITNISGKPVKFEVLDGLPRIVPYGIGDEVLKNMSATGSAWIETEITNCEMPLFKIRASIGDTIEVREIKGANFMASAYYGPHDSKILKPVVDPIAIFGFDTSLIEPENFYKEGLESVFNKTPKLLGQYPSGFSGSQVSLETGESCSILSLFGSSETPERIGKRLLDLLERDLFLNKEDESRTIIDEITAPFHMESGMPELDCYSAVTGLDNSLRGGVPIIYKNKIDSVTDHVYSRKHGDMERDYNWFDLPSSPYSAGIGNYRDVNQNRRTDVFMNPDVNDSIIIHFMSLIQHDGYNPLIVKPGILKVREEHKDYLHMKYPDLQEILLTNEGFRPGDLYSMAGSYDSDSVINEIISLSTNYPDASLGEGFWVDHWTYNLDLIEQYLRIYPDREEELFFTPNYMWFRSDVKVRPLADRFPISNGNIIMEEHLIIGNEESGSLDNSRSTLLEKLVTLALLKIATLDYEETGLEMEAGRPGWYDALNGLPSLFGSSISDAVELKRLIELLLGLIETYKEKSIIVTENCIELFEGLTISFKLKSLYDRWIDRWNIRDKYRSEVYRDNLSWKSTELNRFALFLSAISARLANNFSKFAIKNGGILPTYLRYEVDGWKRTDKGTAVPGRLKSFIMPLFLEGAVKQMKIATSSKEMNKVASLVQESSLYDRKLKMYKLNTLLDNEPGKIGRAKAFPDGWLENGSIWLHMEYKYLLEILKAGDHETFWNEAENCLIPFLDPAIYGRSIYENSSFIVSSSYRDESVHGKGFVARLSGATAEYLTMWTYFLLGSRPFKVENDVLSFKPEPGLPAYLFRGDKTLKWRLFGQTDVTYINETKDDLFGKNEERSLKIQLVREEYIESFHDSVKGDSAVLLRNGGYDEMIVTFS